MTRLGLFELADGVTPERASRFARTLEAVDYPWRRIIPALRGDPDQAVVVRWVDTGQSTSGLYHGATIELHLSELERDAAGEPFVLAHELGHLVDGTTLTREDRDDLRELFHREPFVTIGHYDHDHHDAGHGSEAWRSGANAYVSRLNEAYADAFVAAFAPTLWDGTAEVAGGRRRWPRFVHHPADDELVEVRALTLRRPIMVYTDVPADHPHRETIERAAELGLVAGYPDGSYRPQEPLTRAQAATIAVRQYDRLREELSP